MRREGEGRGVKGDGNVKKGKGRGKKEEKRRGEKGRKMERRERFLSQLNLIPGYRPAFTVWAKWLMAEASNATIRGTRYFLRLTSPQAFSLFVGGPYQ